MRNKFFLIASIFLFQIRVSCQTVFHRKENISVEDFVSTFTETLTTAHHLIKAHTQDKQGSIYLYFIENATNDTIKLNNKVEAINEQNSIIVFSLITYDTKLFYRVAIDTLQYTNNGNEKPEIDTVFFANCDKDKEEELFITFFEFYNRHGKAGNIYKTFAYNFPKENNLIWRKDENISALFDYNSVGSIVEDNTPSKTNEHIKDNNSPTAIKRRLKELGY